MPGLTATGFEVPTLQELRDARNQELRDRIASDLDVSDYAIAGQLAGIQAEKDLEFWNALRDVWAAGNIGSATGEALTQLAMLTGTIRQGAKASTVALTLVLQPGVTVAANSQLRVPGSTDTIWQLDAGPYVNAGGSPLTFTGVSATATETGPRHAAAGTLTEYITPPSGGTATATNPADAVLGQDAELDPILRARQAEERADIGSSNLDAIRAAVEKINGVLSVSAEENVTDATIGALTPHSFRVIVWDAGLADDDEIAQAIWDSRSAGIPAIGSESGLATDTLGNTHTVSFERATQLSIYARLTINVDSLVWDPTNGPTLVKQAVTDYANSHWTVGQIASRSILYGPAYAVGGITNITVLSIGLAPSPSGDSDVIPAATEIPLLDVTRVSVVVL